MVRILCDNLVDDNDSENISPTSLIIHVMKFGSSLRIIRLMPLGNPGKRVKLPVKLPVIAEILLNTGVKAIKTNKIITRLVWGPSDKYFLRWFVIG